jgi:penicillin amidase
MNKVKILVGLSALALIGVLGNTKIGQLPPPVKFFSPFHGLWQNAVDLSKEENVVIKGTNGSSSVVFDERGVPHIFAENTYDLYLLQGYLTAKDRLWQMEFQTHAAAGRISEVIGSKAVEFDLEQRRIGMTYAAEQAMELIKKDSVSMLILNAYADGVNKFISELDDSSLPLEYKLLDYEPEQWSVYKSCLLLKYMAKMLNGTERDRQNTEALKLIGEEMFWKLFPDQRYLDDPIVPGFSINKTSDSALTADDVSLKDTWRTDYVQPAYIGSNNWAVNGSRTESGNAILCNDPHLKLSLPSIWYEIQLHGPDINCYGVSLPGSPGITIGFNKRIAWGVTNAGRDVKDYYRLKIDANGNYRIADSLYSVIPRVEEIKVRGEETVLDTVLYTAYGPIAYAAEDETGGLALRWLAHDASNELKTFYLLNRASNFYDYQNALSHYRCPGQNFVYADVEDNIAIWQQGKFKLKTKNYGRFILDGSADGHLQESFIPQLENPHMKNPERGFVSSANQPVADSVYPYYFSGVYEEFRNRTINRALRSDSSITVQEMKDLQLSNHNLLAEEALPLMLSLLDTNAFQNPEAERLALQELKDWNYANDKGLIAPTVFEIWWDEFNNLLWDEFNEQHWDMDMYYRYSWQQLTENGKAKVDMRDKRFVYPMNKIAIDLLENHPTDIMFDHHASNNKTETAADIVYDSFYWTAMKFHDIIKYEFSAPHWGRYQGTKVQHLLRVDALSSPKLFVGGSEHAPNATTSTHGPSWRMVVEMDENGPKGFGVLPGGQSGNPGSDKYIYSLDSWANGNYHELHFLKSPEEVQKGWTLIKTKAQ